MDNRFWRDRRVLLTGHTGFKGCWTLLWLQRLGAEVHGLALEPPEGQSLWRGLGAPLGDASLGDIRDVDRVVEAFEKARPEIVIHMAAQALVHPSYEDPSGTFDTNVMGLVRILDAARSTASVRAVVNVTSDKCYENREQIWAYREDEPMGGSDPYSASKGCAELVTASYRRSFFNKPEGPWLASGRAGNVIGGGDWAKDRLIPDCVRAFSADQPVLIRNPLATRPWQHVLEPISGYLALAQALMERGAEVADGWNFGPSDTDAWPVGRVVDLAVRAWGEGARSELDPKSHAKEAMLLRVDPTKARTRLNWRSRLTVQQGLSWTLDWYKHVLEGGEPLEMTSRQIQAYEAIGVEV